MVNRLNNRCNILPASGSSCSECIDTCGQRICNNILCPEQCREFITVVRKICHKFFKDYNRSMCREKYRIFDGGNSINVRIHRSGSRGSGDYVSKQRYGKTLQDNNYNKYGKQNNEIDESDRRAKHTLNRSKRKIDGDEIDADLSNHEKGSDYNSGKSKRDKSKNKADKDGIKNDDIVEQRKQRSKRSKHARSAEDIHDGQYDEITTKEKQTFSKDIYGKGKNNNKIDKRERKDKNTKRNVGRYEEEVDEQEQFRQKTMKGKFGKALERNENAGNDKLYEVQMENRKSKRTKGNANNIHMKKRGQSIIGDNESLIDENERASKKLGKFRKRQNEKKSIPYDEDQEYNRGDIKKNKLKNTKTKYKEMFNGEIPSDEESNNKQRKGLKTKGFIVNKFGGKKYIKNYNGVDYINKTTKGKSNRIISDFRNKKRQGDKDGTYEGLSFNRINKSDKVMNQNGETLPCAKYKFSRADEVKACDYLRAQMEERELCRLQCPTKECVYICIPQICASGFFPNSKNCCNLETCKC